MQTPFDFMLPKTDWKPPDVNTLPMWPDKARICIDLETKDPTLRDSAGVKGLGPGNFRPGCHAVGYAVNIEDYGSFYLPIRHEGGDNLNEGAVLSYLRDQAKTFKGTLVGCNLGYDLGFAQKDKIEFSDSVTYHDVTNQAVVLYELHDRYSLEALCEREGIPGKDETALRQFASAHKVDPKRDMYKLPARAVGAYAIGDVERPMLLSRRYDKRIEDDGLDNIWKLESDVLPILTAMRKRGVRINLGKLEAMVVWATRRANEMLDKAAMLSGVRINFEQVWEAEAMAMPLKKMGFKVPTTDAKKPKSSITGAYLDKCGELGQALGRARDYSKILQFAARNRRYQVNGRIHPVFHQLRNTKEADSSGREETKGARFGRFSGEHPNMQQEFGRDDEFGAMWRDIYEPEEGGFWVASDWSQQEPRFAVHYAEKLGLPKAKEFADKYRSDPKTDCHQLLSDITQIKRKIVKNYFNGSIYGMGEAKLCRSLGYPTEMRNINGKVREVPGPEGRKIIDQIKKEVPWVFMLTREAGKAAEKNGCVWTILGRKCNFPRTMDGTGFDWTHKAFSRIGQGGAGDQGKATLVAAHRAGIPINLIIHDEFSFTAYDMKHVKTLDTLMKETVQLSVPMQVDQEFGPSWGLAKKLDEGGREYLKEAGFM